MQSNTGFVLERIHNSEQGFAIRDTEPGGAVNNGITMQTYRKWKAVQKQPEPTIDDLKAMTLNEEHQIYTAFYLSPIRFDELPSGLDYVIADTSVNSGVTSALSIGRDIFKLPFPERSWVMEDQLLDKIKELNILTTINNWCDARWEIMKSKPDFNTPSRVIPNRVIGDGRAFRMNVCYGGALELAKILLPPTARYQVIHNV